MKMLILLCLFGLSVLSTCSEAERYEQTLMELLKDLKRQKECGADQFRCANGACIPLAKRCDGYPWRKDCFDGSDEEDCTKEECATNGKFHCKNDHCVDPESKCDTWNDCGDNSDETAHAGCQCTSSQFTCADGSCIADYLKCNGWMQCFDGSDELNCPTKAPAKNTNAWGTSAWRKTANWGLGTHYEQVLRELLKDLEE